MLLIAILFAVAGCGTPVETNDNSDNKEVEVKATDDAPFAALAFKVMTDPFVGKLTYVRVYSGKITSGSYVYNSTKGKKERFARILLMHANSRREINELYSGEIARRVTMRL